MLTEYHMIYEWEIKQNVKQTSELGWWITFNLDISQGVLVGK